MSALCLYSCGNYTDEEDGVCRKCKGMSSAAEILARLKIGDNNSPVIPRLDRGIQVKPTETKSMAKKQCDEVGCTKRNFMKGVCYSHFIEKYGRDALPESMRKGSSGTKIVGGGKVKKAKPTTPASGHPSLNKAGSQKNPDTHDFVGMIEGLIIGEVQKRTADILNIVRTGLDELEQAPVQEINDRLLMLREYMNEWERKHAA